MAFASLLTRLGVLSAHPIAFAVLAAYVALWVAFDRDNLDWHGIATVATWAMTLLIQRAEHRDTQAIQAKLDELLRVSQDADSTLIKLDREEPETIERQRETAPAASS